MENPIISKIQKILALGRRGGTEAEADTAMKLAHEFLAKHNLSMENVDGQEVEEENYVTDTGDEATKNNSWKDLIFASISELYFCDYFKQQRVHGKYRHAIIGKQSNIAIVKTITHYIIKTGEKLSLEYHNESKWRESFRRGFSHRIAERVKHEIARAKNNELTDSDTGMALILHPLYNRVENEIEQYKKDVGLRLTSRKARSRLVIAEAYRNGQSAGETVSLRSNLIWN